MKRQILKHGGLFAIVIGAVMLATPAFADYQSTTPGSGITTNNPNPAPGSKVTITATFTGQPAGTAITFSAVGLPAGCTVTFNPTTVSLSASQTASTDVVASAGCAGQNINIRATAANGEFVTTTLAISGGFPNTSRSPVALGWIVMGLGSLLVLLGVAGVARRRSPVGAAA